MTDVVDKKTRSRMMAGIRGKNTRPELAIRNGLFRAGFRYRLHASDLPGKPDLYLPQYRAVILVHGCFWHGHKCQLFKWPSSNRDFWKAKITRNRKVDRMVEDRLKKSNLRRGTVWECALKGRAKIPLSWVLVRLVRWLKSERKKIVIAGFIRTGSRKRLR